MSTEPGKQPSRAAHFYLMGGLRIRSEFELPELSPIPSATRDPNVDVDVDVKRGKVPEALPGSVRANVQAEVTPGEVLIKVPEVARYLVRQGREVLVEEAAGAESRNVRLFLLGSAFGAICFQRGLFPLHASVIMVDDAAVAFVGESGSGKSTMAAWMNAQGHPLLCDDVCVIRMDDSRGAIAHAGFPRLKLWSDALEAFSIGTDDLQRDYYRADKYHLPVTGRFNTGPVRLQQVFVLEFSDEVRTPQVEPVKPAEAFTILRDNTYRFEYIGGLQLTQRHFLDCAELARQVDVRRLIRPRDHGLLAGCQALIESHLP